MSAYWLQRAKNNNRPSIVRLIEYLVYAGLAVAVCFVGAALWQDDRVEERTVNLVEETPQLYPRVCELHGSELEWDRVGIGYGLMLYGPNDKELFPHSNKWVGGGCLGGGLPRYGLILYCRECRAVELALSTKAESNRDN